MSTMEGGGSASQVFDLFFCLCTPLSYYLYLCQQQGGLSIKHAFEWGDLLY